MVFLNIVVVVQQASEYFCQENCDVVVLETGLGGRLDPTNSCTPVVTSVCFFVSLVYFFNRFSRALWLSLCLPVCLSCDTTSTKFHLCVSLSCASCITSIGLDHCDLLGDNVSAIGREKAGIIKPHVPVVLGATCPPVVQEIAVAQTAPIIQVRPFAQFFLLLFCFLSRFTICAFLLA